MNTGFRNAPIGRKMTLVAGGAAAFGLLLAAAALIGLAYRDQLDNSRHELQTIGSLLASNSTAALSFNDAASATEVLQSLSATTNIVRACLYRTEDTTAFATYVRATHAPCDQSTENNKEPVLTLSLPVRLLMEDIGHLELTSSLAPLRAQLRAQISITLSILIGSLLFTVPLMSRLQRVITDPVVRLGNLAREVSETHDYTKRATTNSTDEIGQLTNDFNMMLTRIERSNLDLLHTQNNLAQQVDETRAANTELEAAFARLRAAQEQLVQTEKLASLGGLVAGVAHEINTPVGVGVTAASTLRTQIEDMRALYETQQLKKSQLNTFMEIADKSSQIILSNLQRAADLVQSFKRVAVDQSSSERRHFDLQQYVDEVLTSLTPQLKKTSHHVRNQIPEGIVIDTYPGALAQVLTNLVNNALLHAFEGMENGQCTIQAVVDDATVVLSFEDNGVGMPKDHAQQVFDPFFTTKRGSGGSGLGMHIVYNLSTQMLHGHIKVQSEPGRGTTFTLRFPKQAPTTPEHTA